MQQKQASCGLSSFYIDSTSWSSPFSLLLTNSLLTITYHRIYNPIFMEILPNLCRKIYSPKFKQAMAFWCCLFNFKVLIYNFYYQYHSNFCTPSYSVNVYCTCMLSTSPYGMYSNNDLLIVVISWKIWYANRGTRHYGGGQLMVSQISALHL